MQRILYQISLFLLIFSKNRQTAVLYYLLLLAHTPKWNIEGTNKFLPPLYVNCRFSVCTVGEYKVTYNSSLPQVIQKMSKNRLI